MTPLLLAPGDLLDEAEVAGILGTSRRALKSRRIRGTAPPAIRVGGRRPWKYPRGQLYAWLASRPGAAIADGTATQATAPDLPEVAAA